MSTVVVSGALANKAGNGGAAWTRLSWTLGFARLGFDVVFVEQISPDACTDEAVAWFRKITGGFGMQGSSALLSGDGRSVCGLSYEAVADSIASAELLVNISGHLTLPELRRRARRSAYIDLDPGFTQFWHASGTPGARLAGHDLYFTVGANIGSPGCPIPTGGLPWRAVRQPVLLDEWPAVPHARFDRFTTVGSWRGPYGPVTFAGVTYGLKVHEFRRFSALPRMAGLEFELALDIHPADGADLEQLAADGWRLADPSAVAGDPWTFRRYVQGSGAELSCAQGVYVKTGSGWFSDRTVRYLASGRPALVQDTGFARSLPCGEGLLAFSTPGQARDGARAIASDYERHAKAARALAEEHFAAEVALAVVCEEAGIAP